MGGRLSGWLINLRPLRLVPLIPLCRGLSWRRLGVFGRSSCSRTVSRMRRSLGWSLQRPERRAVERDESEIARWVAQEWPRIKRGR
ncbi:winged helix-turn-helix domain-containing protein [Streptomyces sp. NPDC056437]|uniref:winged helix-turn-helix domain-containing protein n=1 Tax=Streptomyces sp. NPDC056437 TaxID=3345816 RepID=UPI003674E77C